MATKLELEVALGNLLNAVSAWHGAASDTDLPILEAEEEVVEAHNCAIYVLGRTDVLGYRGQGDPEDEEG